MSVAIEEFALGLPSDWLSPSHRCYRPPNWPPPRDWVVSEDRDGNILSRWGDPQWNLAPWAGKSVVLNFTAESKGGSARPLDPANADLMRLLTTWRMWGPRAVRTTNSLCSNFFKPIRRIIALCSDNGILANDLMRFPSVLDQVPGTIGPSNYDSVVALLHRLWDAREQTGVVLLSPEGIKRLLEATPSHEHAQTAYIPPRIWTYQVLRLRKCLDEFLAHRQQVEDCFNFCVDAYAHNFGSLEAAMMGGRTNNCVLPFGNQGRRISGVRTGRLHLGGFAVTADRFGIKDLLQRWVPLRARGLALKQFSGYLSLVQCAGLAYIVNFTLQRIEEAASLRSDCLIWEMDEKFGRLPIICGETTKTDADSDARWPTSPSVEVAVAAMSSVARLRLRCAAANSKIGLTQIDNNNPYLFDRTFEPWAGCTGRGTPYTVRPTTIGYQALVQRCPGLFGVEELRITEEDLRIALMVTPTLANDERIAVGKVWPLAWHQLRRTGAVNMFASGLLSDSSMQFLMKHASRLMPIYYGRGHSKLHFNEEVEGIVVKAMYQAMADNLLSAMSDRFVSPLGEDRKRTIVVNLVGDKDAKGLAAAARRGQTSFREIRLGVCTKRGPCEYGGVESVSRCAGGDGGGPCGDVLYDKSKQGAVQQQLERAERDWAITPVASPRREALLAERIGMENFLNVVRN